jgi:hypothetical protein
MPESEDALQRLIKRADEQDKYFRGVVRDLADLITMLAHGQAELLTNLALQSAEHAHKMRQSEERHAAALQEHDEWLKHFQERLDALCNVLMLKAGKDLVS